MRLKSITIRNYRVHRDVTVPLDESRTLIGGPNECGKSTLVEATHRALFLKSKVTGDVQKSMVSSRFAGSPEVEVVFVNEDGSPVTVNTVKMLFVRLRQRAGVRRICFGTRSPRRI